LRCAIWHAERDVAHVKPSEISVQFELDVRAASIVREQLTSVGGSSA
jgi:hypothetical protein